MANYPLQLYSPHDVDNPEASIGRKWNDYPVKFLAQGDSWFSIGAMPPWATSSILQQIVLGFSASAVNCAYPGRHLARMVDWKKDSGFANLLTGRLSEKWDGILLSGGGNDLIEAASTLPTHSGGRPIEKARRLLLTADEWGPASKGAERYLSEEGWATFAAHLPAQLIDVVKLRDKEEKNRGIPLFCHTYDYLIPRDAPASVRFHIGPWLYPAFKAFKIPAPLWKDVANVLISRLAALLRETVDTINAKGDKRVHLIETLGTLDLPEPGSKGENGDWENEIHPTSRGYRKLARRWRPVVDEQFNHLLQAAAPQ